MKNTFLLAAFLFFQLAGMHAQSFLVEKYLPKEFKKLERFNTPMEFKYDSINVYAICTGFISTDKKFPEPVFVWLIKAPDGNYLIDAGLSPLINSPDYFKGISKNFFEKKFDFFIYKENDLITQLNKLGVDTRINSIVLTHGHFDHIGYLDKLKTEPVFLTKEEKDQIEKFGQTAGYEKNTGQLINFNRVKTVDIKKYNTIPISRYLTVIRTDDHTKGHQMILLTAGAKKILFTGDVNLSDQKKSELISFLDKTYNIKTLTLFYNHASELVGN